MSVFEDVKNDGIIAQLEAEIDRLRAALTRIMELGYHSLDPDVDKRMTELARKALE